jgi:hypothetical protein
LTGLESIVVVVPLDDYIEVAVRTIVATDAAAEDIEGSRWSWRGPVGEDCG